MKHRKRAFLAGMAGCLALGACVPFLTSAAGVEQPKPKAGKGKWVDYRDLKEADRVRNRPGNFQVLRAISDFLAGLYEVRPNYRRCAFPFQQDSETIPSLEVLEKRLDEEAARAGTKTNKLRSYNIDIRSLTVYDPDEMIKSAELQKKANWREYQLNRLKAVRKRHPGRAVLVLANIALHSLQSPKVEGGKKENIVFYLIHREGTWKVAWFDK